MPADMTSQKPDSSTRWFARRAPKRAEPLERVVERRQIEQMRVVAELGEGARRIAGDRPRPAVERRHHEDLEAQAAARGGCLPVLQRPAMRAAGDQQCRSVRQHQRALARRRLARLRVAGDELDAREQHAEIAAREREGQDREIRLDDDDRAREALGERFHVVAEPEADQHDARRRDRLEALDGAPRPPLRLGRGIDQMLQRHAADGERRLSLRGRRERVGRRHHDARETAHERRHARREHAHVVGAEVAHAGPVRSGMLVILSTHRSGRGRAATR